MIADLTPRERRAEAFSISRVALNLGITIGPLVAAPLITLDPGIRLTFLSAGTVRDVFLLMVIFPFKETRPAAARCVSVRAVFGGYGAVLRDRRMLVFCLVALPLYGFGPIWVTMPIMLGDLHGVSAQQWGFAMVVYGAATAALQYPVVRIVGRRDHIAPDGAVEPLHRPRARRSPPGRGRWPSSPSSALGSCCSSRSRRRSSRTSRRPSSATATWVSGRWRTWVATRSARCSAAGHSTRCREEGGFLAIAAAGVLGAALLPLLPARGVSVEREAVEEPASGALGGELRCERPEQAL